MPISATIAMAAIHTSSSNVSPIEAATRVHNLVYLGYVVVLVLAAFFTWLAWKTGNKVQDAIRADANARIAEADSKAEIAKQGAATANEGAAKANERATALENANLTLRGQVATLETGAANAAKDVARLQKEASDAKAAQQRVELELAAQKTELVKYRERAAIAERSLLELQEKLAPRQLTPAGEAALIKALAAGAKGEIEIGYAPDLETSLLADNFVRLLQAAGWTTTVIVEVSSPVLGGLNIEVHDINNAPQRAKALQDALTGIGIPVRALSISGLPKDKLRLFIGPKAP